MENMKKVTGEVKEYFYKCQFLLKSNYISVIYDFPWFFLANKFKDY